MKRLSLIAALAVAACTCPPSHVDAKLVGPSVLAAVPDARAHRIEQGATEESQSVKELDDLAEVFDAAMKAGN